MYLIQLYLIIGPRISGYYSMHACRLYCTILTILEHEMLAPAWPLLHEERKKCIQVIKGPNKEPILLGRATLLSQ
jgi:hypothetical protein